MSDSARNPGSSWDLGFEEDPDILQTKQYDFHVGKIMIQMISELYNNYRSLKHKLSAFQWYIMPGYEQKYYLWYGSTILQNCFKIAVRGQNDGKDE